MSNKNDIYPSYLLRSDALTNGLHSVILRIIHKRKKKEFTLNLKCKKSEFRNGEFTRQHPNHKARNDYLNSIKEKVNKIIDELVFEKVEDPLGVLIKRFKDPDYLKDTEKKDSVFDFFRTRIDEMYILGRAGNGVAYKGTLNSLVKFCGNDVLYFNEVNYTFLRNYETYLKTQNNTDSGVAFKMRELRAIINEAIKRGIANKEDYPFNEYKVSKLKSSPERRALNIDELKLILNFDVSGYPHLLNSYNYFVFSFYTRGMNFSDMVLLKWKNIESNNIRYIRSKTKKKFIIEILPPVHKILQYYSTIKNRSDYVFPVIQREDYTPLQLNTRKHKALYFYNRDLNELARITGIKKVLSSYVARHSYATYLKFSGVSTDIISESMGHSNLNVTQAYLKSFDNETINDANRILLDLYK